MIFRRDVAGAIPAFSFVVSVGVGSPDWLVSSQPLKAAVLANLLTASAEGGETGAKTGRGITRQRSAAKGRDRCWGGPFSRLSEGGGCASTLNVPQWRSACPNPKGPGTA